jgi:GNAT superfamily N-acetyltransferase
MPAFNIIKEIPENKSYRVASVCGKFDLSTTKIKESFTGRIDLPKEWQVGVIYGNSGTGKSTIAKEVFRDGYLERFKYREKSILDDMPKEKRMDEITKILNSVGFSSPPSWIKPYSVLSTGEKMRVDLARALLTEREVVVFDEFTSVVDRNIAKIASFSVQKAVRRTGKKFIAVSCHQDILPWIQPDWTFCTNNMKFNLTRGLLRRPKIEIRIYKEKEQWDIFKKYHYLGDSLLLSSDQYVGYIGKRPVCFIAICTQPHPKVRDIKRIHRLVVLPDYQGVGIGWKILNEMRNIYKNYRYRIITSSPALFWALKESKKWSLIDYGRNRAASRGRKDGGKNINVSRNTGKRNTSTWEYRDK